MGDNVGNIGGNLRVIGIMESKLEATIGFRV